MRLFRATLALALALAVAACASRAANDEERVPARFIVASGEHFDIRLEANPSTGYQWRIGQPLDEAVVKFIGTDFQRGAQAPEPTPAAAPRAPGESGDSSARVGQEGIETWRFGGVAAGRTTIELVYVRPWEEEIAPARIAVYSIEVR